MRYVRIDPNNDRTDVGIAFLLLWYRYAAHIASESGIA